MIYRVYVDDILTTSDIMDTRTSVIVCFIFIQGFGASLQQYEITTQLEKCVVQLDTTCYPLPTSSLHPVCGSDNITYSSLCHLYFTSCSTPNVTLRHRGRCQQSPQTKCQIHRKQAVVQKGAYLPKCTNDGAYAQVQCYRGTEFCWCVDEDGNPSKSVFVKLRGKKKCEEKGKSNLRRRSPTRRGPRRSCNLTDKALFNSNLIEKFQTEWLRLHDEDSVPSADLDRVVLDWKFKDMDKNRDGKLDKNEYQNLKKLVRKFVKPKRCSKSFAQACDIDRDQHISSQEWGDCLTRDGMNEDSRRDGDGGHSNGDSSELDDEDEDEDYMDFSPSTRRSPPPIEILRNPGNLDSGSHTSGEDSHEPQEETDCLTDRQSVLNEQRADTLYVPECTPDGRYKKIQCYKSVGYCWCVHEDTGKNIPGTSVQHAMPKCDQIPASTRPMKGCPEPKKTAFLKDLMEYLHNRMVTGTNDTNITGSESGAWQASQEEKAATWNFVVLDKNKNKVLERKEWKVFRSLVSSQKQLKRCGKKLPRYCDVNSDQKISLSEWLECLNTKRNIPGSQNQKQPPQRQGKNPLLSILKDD